MTWGGVAETERIGSTRLERWSGPGGTSLRVRTTPHSLIGWVVVGAYTTRAELREVSSVENRDITIDALTYYHDPDEMVLVLATPALNIMWFDARGKGLTHDDTAAIQATVKAAGDYGGTVNVPPAKSFWNTTYAIRVPSYVTIQGDGERSHIKHTGTSASADWPGQDWFALCMFYVGDLPGQAEWLTPPLPVSPYYHLTYYGIAAAAAGTVQLTFDTNAEADNFTAGDVVFLKSGTTFTDPLYDGTIIDEFYPPLYVQVNIVRSVGDGTIDLVYPLNHDFDAGSSVATEAEPYIGDDGGNIYMAQNATMRDLYLEMDNGVNSGYAIYASGINLLFENIKIDHQRYAFGSNGFCYSKINNMTVNWVDNFAAGKYPVDIAHHSHNSIISGLVMDRGGVNIAEPGAFITLEDFYIGYGHVFAGWKHYVTIRNGKIGRFDTGVSTSQSSAVTAGYVESVGYVVDNVTIDGLTGLKYGIAVHGTETIVRNCHIKASTTANAFGIVVNENAKNYLIEGNALGKWGAFGPNDFIRPLGTSYLYGKIENNISKISIPKKRSFALATADEAATDETLKTEAFLANQFRYHCGVRIFAYGTVTGTNDEKTITLHNSAVSGDPAMATIALAAGETGAWRIEAFLHSEGISATSTVRCNALCVAPAAALEQHQEYYSASPNGADLTADWAITLVGNVANANDRIYCTGWIVDPIQDQYSFL